VSRRTPLHLRWAWIRAADNAAKREPRPVEHVGGPYADISPAGEVSSPREDLEQALGPLVLYEDGPEATSARLRTADPDLRRQSGEPPDRWYGAGDLSGW
jgi:hypothetical protein